MKIILNVKITDHRIGYPYDNGRGPWQPRSNRYDVFKYCLASYAVLDPLVTKYHFYITLADDYIDKQQELTDYIKSIFPEDKLDLNWNRIDYCRDWRKLCNDHLDNDDEVIWFAGNDDHIFIDYNLDMVKASIDVLQQDIDPLAVVYYSHWPEQVQMSHRLNGELTEDKNFVKFKWDNYDGIQMFKVSRFKRYWFDADYGDHLVFRPDDLKNLFGYALPSTFYSPTREMVRHYDGYVHIGTEITNWAPALFIPPGFFNKEMKIKIGFDSRDNEYTNFHPESANLYNTSQSGADYRFVEEDIPLFWKNHIIEITKPSTYNQEQMLKSRDVAFLRTTKTPISCFGYQFNETSAPPADWFSNHLRYS